MQHKQYITCHKRIEKEIFEGPITLIIIIKRKVIRKIVIVSTPKIVLFMYGSEILIYGKIFLFVNLSLLSH